MSAANARAAKRRTMRPPRDPGGGAYDPRTGATSDPHRGLRWPTEGGIVHKTAEDEGAKGDYVNMYKRQRRRA